MRQASKTCPHQMSAPQFSRKIQNAFNGSKTPIHINKNFSQVVRNFRAQRTNREIREKTAKSKNTHLSGKMRQANPIKSRLPA